MIHDPSTTAATATAATAERGGGDLDPLAPGRGSRSAQLAAPSSPVASALVEQRRTGDGPAGAPLPAATAAALGRAYGADVSSVRVHTDAAAHTAATSLDAEAFAAGDDVFFANGHDPETEHGAFVLAHEVAHVVQGRGAPPSAHAFHAGAGHATAEDAAAEADADAAADAALAGRTATVQRTGGGIRRFAAGHIKRKLRADGGSDFEVAPGGHAYMTVAALEKMKLDHNQAVLGYQGNWMRDLSQAGTPGLVKLLHAENLFAIMNVLSIKEFGRGLDAHEFGTYDPVEHMDNPGDLRAGDTFRQTDRAALPTGPGGTLDPETIIPIAAFEAADDPGAPAGADGEGYGRTGVDPRYTDTLHKTRDEIVNGADEHAFQITAKGMPTYMSTSVEWARSTLHESARLGREDPRGPREFGSGIHAIQDFYAHSNFCEIAVNVAIRNGTLALAGPDGQPARVATDQQLDSHLHPNDAQGDPIKSINLRVKDLPGFDPSKQQQAAHADREVLTTGTFNLTDTAVSMLHVLKEQLLELDPFQDAGPGPSPLVMACLDYMDMTTPDTFNGTGEKIAALIMPVATAVEAAGSVAAAPVEAAGAVAGWGLDRLDEASEALGGDAHFFDGAKAQVTGATAEAAAGIRAVTGALHARAEQFKTEGHVLRRLYAAWKATDLLGPIKATARAVPVVGDSLAAQIEGLEQGIRELLDHVLHLAWSAAVRAACARVQRVIDKVTEQTNLAKKKKVGADPKGPAPTTPLGRIERMIEEVKAGVARTLGGAGDLYDADGQPQKGIGPKGFTSGSHSELAKDHHAQAPASEGHADADDHEHLDDDAAEGAHAHQSDWLNPLAETLASKATQAIGERVSACWDSGERSPTHQPDPGSLSALDAAIDHFMQHPEDCPELWTAEVQRLGSNPAFAARLRAELRTRAS